MKITQCRSCHSSDLVTVVDLDYQRLSYFDESPGWRPPAFPLRLVVCQECTLAQLDYTTPPELLYTDSYSFKSGINEGIRRNLNEVVDHALEYVPAPKRWLDIASNDGTLLSFVPKTTKRIGIDPLKQFATEAAEHADGIVADFFNADLFEGTTFDVITSVSMFYDIDDPNTFVEGVKSILAPDGVWVIQQNYLPTMLENTSIDNLSHEHLAYYSMDSLRPLLIRHGLQIIDAKLDPINGGCFRTVVTHWNADGQAVRSMHELANPSFSDAPTMAEYEAFAERSTRLLIDLKKAVDRFNSEGKRVWIYGASTRGAVLWQAAGLTSEDVPYAVERNPEKVGKYFSAIGSKIISEEEMRADPPDALLCGLYWVRDLIVEREAEYLANGGKLIFPVPKLEVVGG